MGEKGRGGEGVERKDIFKVTSKYLGNINCAFVIASETKLSPSGKRCANAVAGNDTNNEGTPT